MRRTMAKRKPAGEPTPAPGGERKAADQHASGRMVRLSIPLHELLKEAARLNQRPATWELKIALVKHFKELGMAIPDNLD